MMTVSNAKMMPTSSPKATSSRTVATKDTNQTEKSMKEMHVFQGAEELDHIKIFRFESALFFANTEYFKTTLYKMTADPSILKKIKRKADKELLRIQVVPKKSLLLPEEIHAEEQCEAENRAKENGSVTTDQGQALNRTGGTESGVDANEIVTPSASPVSNVEAEVEELTVIRLPTVTDVYFIIIDCTTIGYVDSVGVKILQQVITDLRVFDVQIFFAHCKAAVREMFEKTDFYKTSDKQCLFLTIHDAVRYSQRLLAIVEGKWVVGASRLSVDSIPKPSDTEFFEIA